jgi:S1-C subfamily serine protease
MSSRPDLPPQREDDPMLDLAILRLVGRLDSSIDEGVPEFRPLKSVNSDTVEEGDRLWVIGYGQQNNDVTNTRNITAGILTGRHADKHGNWIRTDAEILGGHSGGPVVNQFGEVAGWCVKSHGERLTDAAGNPVNAFTFTKGLHAFRPFNEALPELDEAVSLLADKVLIQVD